MKNLLNISIYFTLVVACLLLCVQCKEDSPIQKEIDIKHDEIMVIHDEVMPKMKDIYQLKKALKKMVDDSKAVEHTNALNKADDAMMDWMAGYKKPKAKDSDYKDYLSHQLILVKEVKVEMLEAIASAKNYTKQ